MVRFMDDTYACKTTQQFQQAKDVCSGKRDNILPLIAVMTLLLDHATSTGYNTQVSQYVFIREAGGAIRCQGGQLNTEGGVADVCSCRTDYETYLHLYFFLLLPGSKRRLVDYEMPTWGNPRRVESRRRC